MNLSTRWFRNSRISTLDTRRLNDNSYCANSLRRRKINHFHLILLLGVVFSFFLFGASPAFADGPSTTISITNQPTPGANGWFLSTPVNLSYTGDQGTVQTRCVINPTSDPSQVTT